MFQGVRQHPQVPVPLALAGLSQGRPEVRPVWREAVPTPCGLTGPTAPTVCATQSETRSDGHAEPHGSLAALGICEGQRVRMWGVSGFLRWLGGLAAGVGLYIGQIAVPTSVLPSDSPWRLIAVVIAGMLIVVSLVVAAQNIPHPQMVFQRRSGKPVLRVKKTTEYWRSGNGSAVSNGSVLQDLQVIYARVTNEGRGPAKHAQIWIEAFAITDRQTSVSGNKGNWLDLSMGRPQILSSKTWTLLPNGEEYGIEVAGKFSWGQEAWIAGEGDPPSLQAGTTYMLRASVTSVGVLRPTVLEWEVENRGANSPLICREIEQSGSRWQKGLDWLKPRQRGFVQTIATIFGCLMLTGIPIGIASGQYQDITLGIGFALYSLPIAFLGVRAKIPLIRASKLSNKITGWTLLFLILVFFPAAPFSATPHH